MNPIERTVLSSGDDKEQSIKSVDGLLMSELTNKATFAALPDDAKDELMRRAIVLILRIILRRLLK